MSQCRTRPQFSRQLHGFRRCFENRRAPLTLAHARGVLWKVSVMTNNRNVLYLIIGVLVVGVGVLGYNLYQARKQPEGVQINLGPNGLKIESK